MQRKLLFTSFVAAVFAAGFTTQASLIQHLIATNETSVVTNETGTVSNWLDDSGNGNDTANAGAIVGTPKWPSPSLSASGLPGVQFGIDGSTRRGMRFWSIAAQDTWLDFTGAAAGKSGFAVLVAFKVDSTPTNGASRNIVIGNHGNPAANNSFVLKYESGYPTVYIGGGTSNPQRINYNPAAAIAAGDTLVFAFNYEAATGFWELWDSKSGGRMTNTAAINGNFSSVQNMWLGTTDNGAQYFNGMIAEVSVYDNVLSSNDLATARQEMSSRWVTPPATVLAPTLTSAFGGDSAVLLSWLNNNPPGSVSNYVVYRSLTSGSGYAPIATNAPTTLTDTGLVNGTPYYYVVSAVSTNGTVSPISNEQGATPIDIATNAVLIQHLDATDTNSVIALGDPLFQLLEWDDLTGNFNNATPYVGTPLYPSASLSGSGLAGVDLNADSTGGRAGLTLFTAANSKNWLDFTGNAKTNGGFSALVAFKADQVSNAFNPVLVNNGDTTIAGTFGLKFNGSGVMQLYFNGSLYTRPTRVAPGDTVIYALTYDERTGAVEFWDSKNNSSLLVTNLPYLNLSASLVTMGANSLATHWFNGMIGEVKIFTGKLPASSFQSEREALATKWGATVASTNAYLADLVLSDGTLTPAFSSNILSYTASVSNEVTSLTVTPTAADDAATIAVRVNGGNYAPVTSGSMSDALNLNEGANTVDVRVTAQNLAFTSIYTTTVTRAAAAPTPESITTTVNNGNLILSWTQANWSLATGTNVTAITNIIAGATSPYTNALSSDPQRYFRLVFP